MRKLRMTGQYCNELVDFPLSSAFCTCDLPNASKQCVNETELYLAPHKKETALINMVADIVIARCCRSPLQKTVIQLQMSFVANVLSVHAVIRQCTMNGGQRTKQNVQLWNNSELHL